MKHETESEKERVLREALANALLDVTAEVAEPIAVLKKRARTMKIVIWTLIWLKALTTGTIVVLFMTLNTMKDQQGEIEQIQNRTNNEVLCPLYDLFEVAGKLPAPPNYNKEQKEQRAFMFEKIHEGSAKLNCNGFEGKTAP